MRLRLRALEGEVATEALFERLFADAENAFWLDSVDAPTRLAQCSYMGTTAGATAACHLRRRSGEVTVDRGRRDTVERKSIFDFLHPGVARHAVAPPRSGTGLDRRLRRLLGYELKADCGSPNVHSSDMPDAGMMLANRVIAVDHVRRRDLRLRALPRGGRRGRAWLETAAAAVAETIADPPAPVADAAR